MAAVGPAAAGAGGFAAAGTLSVQQAAVAGGLAPVVLGGKEQGMWRAYALPSCSVVGEEYVSYVMLSVAT